MLCSNCGAVLKPVVALDIDGTLGDYHTHLLDFMRDYFGREFSHRWDGEGNWEDFLGLNREQYRDAKLAFRQGGLKRTMPVFGGAVALTHALHQAGAEVWITTTRPWMRLDSVDPDTREWLNRNGFYYDHLLYDEHKYEILAERVNPYRVVSVLDDLLEQCEEASKVFHPSKVFQAFRQHNRHDTQRRDQGMESLETVCEVFVAHVNGWYLHHG